jgi:acyl-CoA synthetase (AMP-forming)/AMP-acid ligase II
MTPTDHLEHQAQTRARHVAFISENEIWNYQRLASESERLARALVTRGVRQGDRVALHMANLPEMATAYFACFRVGAIACPINNRLKTAELRPLLQRLQPVLYIGQSQLYPEVADIAPTVLASDRRFIVGGTVEDGRARLWASLFESTAETSISGDRDVNLPAVLLTTSGTTGQPKFVTHTPATLAAITNAWAHLGLKNQQMAMHCLPMVHASGLYTFLACVRFGVPMVLVERFDPDAVLDAIEVHRCTWLPGLPFMFAALVENQRARPRRVNSLRLCLTAGDVCPAQLQQDFPHLFGVPLRSFWASTEAVGLSYGLQRGPVSRIARGTQIRLVDGDGIPVPRGEVGELLIRAANVTVGYWNGPGCIDDATDDGWFPTGDLMRRGEGVDLWFVSRKKELIVRGGSKISPIEVENVLRTHPAVRDIAVIGVPDVVLGQRVAAFVELTDSASSEALDDILASAKRQLADYKVPETLKVVNRVPKNALGKIDRNSLSAML